MSSVWVVLEDDGDSAVTMSINASLEGAKKFVQDLYANHGSKFTLRWNNPLEDIPGEVRHSASYLFPSGIPSVEYLIYEWEVGP